MPTRRTLSILALVAVLLGSVVPVGAHTQVQRATPGPGASVEGELDVVVLEFLDPVLPTPTIVVTGPDGRPVAGLRSAELLAEDVAAARFDPLTAAGEYRVDYSFVALDGDEQVSAHTFAFRPGGGGDVEVRPLLAALVGAVVAVLAVWALIGRRRSRG